MVGSGNRQVESIYTEYFPDRNVILYFVPKLNSDGNSYSYEEGKFVRAVYVGFEPVNGMNEKKVGEELEAKLNELYG